MPGTSKIYSAAQIQRGVADLWIDLAEPASGAHKITLFSDGTPDATANPNAKHLGVLEGAAVSQYGPKYDFEKIDQDTAPVVAFLTEEEAVIEATMKQTAFNNVLQYLLPPGFFSDTSAEGVTIGQGGNIVATNATLACIAKSADPAYNWVVALLYKAVPVAAMKIEMGKEKTAVYQVKFQGLTDLTRPAGDRLGSFYRTI